MLDGMIKTDLKIISTERGSVMHALKISEIGFNNFGELYFSTVKKDAIKAWKLHQQMTLNIIAPVGRVLFCFLDVREKSNTFNKTYKIEMSQTPYYRLKIPPGIWFGFKGIDPGLNLICNVADMIYDSNEILRKETNEINMDWNLE